MEDLVVDNNEPPKSLFGSVAKIELVHSIDPISLKSLSEKLVVGAIIIMAVGAGFALVGMILKKSLG